ncbi:hypothetical protein [Petroclostridium sp. X23]|uniref:hypothetical protein n=1 Tax=Petroclostridium sp. X23 TaxID=3045146 RepID=UPI0024ADD250|nr:hypothetical protein [Petroclostridium sp. X23]WHH60318.1 hypothetical protein QKW49_06170 [Petroclostridium sp. X23]
MQQKKDFIIQNTVLILYILLVSTVSIFHEPWFDEAQAWLIARDNTIWDILWHVLRYEGHTPLWHLSLYLPAHIGVPYEWGLKLINLTFASLAAAMIIKKSPFPLLMRLLLPFTYFPFYQYGVISRSYSLLSFILWLVAASFSSRNKSPIKFSLLLALLGGVTLHGVLIAFGVAVAWFLEIILDHHKASRNMNNTACKVIVDIRFYSLLLLGLINASYLAMLWPMPDRFTPLQNQGLNLGDFMFTLFIAPLNSIATDVWPGISSNSIELLLLLFLIGTILTAVFLIYARYNGVLPYVALPYIFTSAFMSFIYFSLHHSGIYMLIILFGIWLMLSNEQPFKTLRDKHTRWHSFNTKIKVSIIRKRCLAVCIMCVFFVQIYWSAAASINDIKLPYVSARDVASFIKQNGIAGRKIFNSYSVWNDKVSFSTQNIALLPYFSNNIFYNHNQGKVNMSFITHRIWSDADAMNYLKNADEPEFVIEYKYPLSFYSDVLTPDDYIPVASFDSHYIWKNQINHDTCNIYIRKDLQTQFPHLNAMIGGN